MTAPDPGTLRARLEGVVDAYAIYPGHDEAADCATALRGALAEIDRLTTERERTAHLLGAIPPQET